MRNRFVESLSFSRLLVVFLLLLTAACVTDSTLRPEGDQNSFRFLFMTDIHVTTERAGDEGFRAAIAAAKEYQPDFVITGGDLVFDVLEQGFEKSKGLYALFSEISAELGVPVHNTLGNHEVFGLYKESGVDPGHPEYGKEMFKKRLGNGHTCSSFDYKGWHFIQLDTVGFTEDRKYFGKVEEKELSWLAADLEKVAPETPIVLSVHIPLLSVQAQVREGACAPLGQSSAVTNSKDVLQLFEDRNLKLVLQGHLHVLEEIVFKGTRFVTGGAVSGAWWKGPYEGCSQGFVVVDVQGDSVQWSYKTYPWEPRV